MSPEESCKQGVEPAQEREKCIEVNKAKRCGRSEDPSKTFDFGHLTVGFGVYPAVFWSYIGRV